MSPPLEESSISPHVHGGMIIDTDEIDLVNIEDNAFPRASNEDLRGCYPVDRPQIMREAGLDPNQTEWPVLLPAYLFHSLDRSDTEIRRAPYLPVEGDWFFPREPV